MITRRIGLRLASVLLGGWIVACAAAQTTVPAADNASMEDALWADITRLRAPAPTTQPFEPWFGQTADQCRALLQALDMYRTLYPGSAHRDEAIRLELNTRFELAALIDAPPTELRRRVAALLADPPSPAAKAEAAYWQMIVDHMMPESTPADLDPQQAQVELVAAYREYVRRYPDSRYVPLLATALFDRGLATGDDALLQALVSELQTHFPNLTTTQQLAARLALRGRLGRPFVVKLPLVDGQSLDTRQWRGRPSLIVVWADFSPAARQTVQDVEALRREHPELAVAGVALDESPTETTAVARALQLPWPQSNDGLGWGNELVRAWGLRAIPRVLVLDRDGRLVGVGDGASWRALAEQVLRPAPTATSQPAN